MLRKIIKIDEEKCVGCGKCASACHEGAIEMINGVAKLSREDYCDGLGDCLPACPVDAISFEEREAPAYDADAVKENMQKKQNQNKKASNNIPFQSRLMQWPCQIKLLPVNAPYFDGAHLLVAADCTAYAYAAFHEDFMKNRITLVGCPKLDNVDYYEKLKEIVEKNNVQSVTVVRMEVPCCGGMENAVKRALRDSGKFIPWQLITISTDGKILNR